MLVVFAATVSKNHTGYKDKYLLQFIYLCAKTLSVLWCRWKTKSFVNIYKYAPLLTYIHVYLSMPAYTHLYLSMPTYGTEYIMCRWWKVEPNNYFIPRADHRFPHQNVDVSRQIFRDSRSCTIYSSLRRRVGPVQTCMIDARNTCFSGWMCTITGDPSK